MLAHRLSNPSRFLPLALIKSGAMLLTNSLIMLTPVRLSAAWSGARDGYFRAAIEVLDTPVLFTDLLVLLGSIQMFPFSLRVGPEGIAVLRNQVSL